MKRYITTLLMTVITCIAAQAMSYSQASREALYLTDKMAYELNLNADQYDYAYEINLDYLLSLNTRADLDGRCFRYRCADFRDILHDWQYQLFMAADYFLRPVVWRATGWFFPVYNHYHHTHFFYDRPRVFVSYHGGHGRPMFHAGYYASRRPHWDGGFRGHDMHHPGHGIRPRVHNSGRPFNTRGNRNQPTMTRPRSSSRNNFDYSSTRSTVNSRRSSTPSSLSSSRGSRPGGGQRRPDNNNPSPSRGARR